MILRLATILYGLTCLASSSAGYDNLNAASDQLSFSVSTGGNDNFFLRDNVTSGQLLLTSSANTSESFSRLVVALPAGNTGALSYFLPLNSSTFSVNLVNGSLATTARTYNNTGLQADLNFTGNATLGVTIVGAVRAMRGKIPLFHST